MSITDSLADSLTIIRNASRAKHLKADLVASRLTEEVLKILKKQGFISNYKKISAGSRSTLRVYLKFTADNRPAIRDLKRISKPSRRVYVKSDKIPIVLQGLGMAILSTSSGVLSNREAKKQKVGGEVLCYIW